jgi:diguanylate cyclase (GGDEF)-like protein/PAS domain S-box-containing protein
LETTKEKLDFNLAQASQEDAVLDVVDQLLHYYHTFLFAITPPPEPPELLLDNRVAEDIRRVLLEVRSALLMASKGNFSYQITSKGFVGGTLKALQANLNHVTWLTRCVANGDLEQRMDFIGDFSESFNMMVDQLTSMLQELKSRQQSLENLTEELQHEVEERKKAEVMLRKEEERWQLAVQCSRDGIWEIDLESDSLPYYSPRLLELTKIPKKDAPKVKEWPQLFHPDDREALALFRSLLFRKDHPISFELDHKLRCGDGVFRWFMTRGMVLLNPVTQKHARIIGVTADIHERKEREERFSHGATHDVLTDLPNRVLFNSHLKNGIEFAKRNGTYVAVIMIDLNKFKAINDTLGHQAGDVLLIEIARRLLKNVRESDMVSRFGGDEFAMILAFGKNEWQGLTKALNRMMTALNKPVSIDGKKVNIGAAMGISVWPGDGDNPKELLTHADEAMDYAKTAGHDITCVFWKPDQNYNVVKFESK